MPWLQWSRANNGAETERVCTDEREELVASMEPRQQWRGNVHVLFSFTCSRVGLQWSRANNGAETTSRSNKEN